jgi:MFS family permease
MFGAAIASFIWGPVMDKVGRKKALAYVLAWFSIWTFACGLSYTYTQLLVFRFFCGLGLGGVWAICSTMITEFFPANQRAKSTSVIQSFWAVGYGVAIGIQIWLVPIFGWQGLFFGGSAALLVAIYIYFFVPESPAWLKVQQEKAHEKTKTISQTAEKKAAEKWTILFKGDNLKPTILATLLSIFLMTAYWGSATWIPAYLAQERGQNVKAMSGYLLYFNVFGFFGYYLYGWFADKVGRRWNFIIGGIVAAVLTIVWIKQTSTDGVFWVGMAYAFFSYGVFGPWGAFVAEQFSDARYRGTGTSIAYGCGRVATVIIPVALGAVATKFDLGIAIGCVAAFFTLTAVTAFFMRETKDMVFK